ncbi:MFS transporter [Mesorhizobium sp. M0898]|uniref:MFS transporter n=1 Tax=unclassified Mesorhizobium TaxID=325217 RepID=UPI003334B267
MAKRTSSLVPFEHKTFRSLWSAALISNLGTLVEGAAAAWLMTSIAAVIFDRPFVLCTSPVSCASGHERLPEPRRRPKNTCCDFEHA